MKSLRSEEGIVMDISNPGQPLLSTWFFNKLEDLNVALQEWHEKRMLELDTLCVARWRWKS